MLQDITSKAQAIFREAYLAARQVEPLLSCCTVEDEAIPLALSYVSEFAMHPEEPAWREQIAQTARDAAGLPYRLILNALGADIGMGRIVAVDAADAFAFHLGEPVIEVADDVSALDFSASLRVGFRIHKDAIRSKEAFIEPDVAGVVRHLQATGTARLWLCAPEAEYAVRRCGIDPVVSAYLSNQITAKHWFREQERRNQPAVA